MVRKMSNEHKIGFLDSIPEMTAKTSEVKLEKPLNEVIQEQRSKSLNNKDNGFMTNHHISSARTGDISDVGGPNKFVKSESSNVIWDNDKIAKMSKELDSKTKTRMEKAQIADNKRVAEQTRMNEMVENLKSIDQDKADTVTSVGTYQGYKYTTPKKNMSMFDTIDFQRLAEQTEGERISKEVQEKKSQKDDSWKNDGKNLTSQDLVRGLFDNLLNLRHHNKEKDR
jgi:hypothetical protein